MGKKQFTDEQIAFSLRQAVSGTSLAKIIRKLGIDEMLGCLRHASEVSGEHGGWRCVATRVIRAPTHRQARAHPRSPILHQP